MTDFASQGKTRPWNISDLNNLRSHQSYYTVLSRSATADSTLILQGFDAKVITGRCSGALRQEFQKLELLDKITSLWYAGKLLVTIMGDTRINVIVVFREWKGEQNVPQSVHASIRWSKHSPWLESKVLNLDEWLKLLENNRKNKAKTLNEKLNEKVVPLPCTKSYEILGKSVQGKSNAEKRRRSNGQRRVSQGKSNAEKRRRSNGQRRVSHEACAQAAKKQKLNRSSAVLPHAGHYQAPVGCRWSQNSCAYDALSGMMVKYGEYTWSAEWEIGPSIMEPANSAEL